MNKMRYVANRHTDAKEKRMYQDAARRFRLPFWDPYLPRNRVAQSNPVSENIWGLPQILAADKVYVRYPGKKDMDPIDNPLYLYKLPPEKLIKEKGRIGINWDRKDLQNMVSFNISSSDHSLNGKFIPLPSPQKLSYKRFGHRILKEKPISMTLRTEPA